MLTIALIGAGNRGTYAFGKYFLMNPEEGKIIAVAEPDEIKREKFAKEHKIPTENIFTSWETLLKEDKLADAIIIANNDNDHYLPTKLALERGYHILLEKPMSNKLMDLIKIENLAKIHKEQVFMVCHVLRYTPFFSNLKEIIDSKELGDLISIQHNENIAYWHFAHSYVRGNWKNSNDTSPLILSKSCHDIDLLLWLTGQKCLNVSAFGHLTHFNKKNFLNNMSERCLDCPLEFKCPYSAKKFYLEEDNSFKYVVHPIPTKANIEKALKEGPYGKCVYQSDNNVVDHMVVIFEFENEITATFNLSAFTKEYNRTIKLMFTHGEIYGNFNDNTIEIKRFRAIDEEEVETIRPKTLQGFHGGGDTGLIKDFVRLVQSGKTNGKTTAIKSVESHIIAFAVEYSRLTKEVVNIEYFWNVMCKK